MFNRFSGIIAEKLEEHRIIEKSDRALYEYGLRQMFITFLNIFTMLLIGLTMKMTIPAIIYIFAYIPIRIYSGGYHASTPLKCWAFSAVILFSMLWLLKNINETYFIVLNLMSLLICSLIVWLAPVETKNKPLDNTERKVYHKRTCIILAIEFIIVVILFLLKLKVIVSTIELAWFSILFMLVLEKIKRKNKKRRG